MAKRIRAAWKVLRGEWTAQPRTRPSVWNQQNVSTSTACRVVWTQPPAFDPAAAGRRAVRKHGEALRRLAE